MVDLTLTEVLQRLYERQAKGNKAPRFYRFSPGRGVFVEPDPKPIGD